MNNTFTASFGFPIGKEQLTPNGSQPPLANLLILVCGAVLEVVCVSLPGYLIAKSGMFDVEMQKFVANLNVTLFTPCLIFTKLASQLTLSKIAELAVIPVIFVVMTFVSYFCSLAVAKMFGFNKRARNFVIAMGVFGNSNSLPISLVVSLSMTISGLHWDRLPNDSDEEVAARGILYLLIFQQLGQLVRWSWGYHVLLAPPRAHGEDDQHDQYVVVRRESYHDEVPGEEEENDIEGQQPSSDPFKNPKFENSFAGLHIPSEADPTETAALLSKYDIRHHSGTDTATTSGNQTPATPYSSNSQISISSRPSTASSLATVAAGTPGNDGTEGITSFPPTTEQSSPGTLPRWTSSGSASVYIRAFRAVKNGSIRFGKGLWSFMNPPLWAMLLAVIVATIPSLQRLFFTPGTFVQNSVTRAVSQSGNVAVPLILVVLGANLGGNTQARKNAVSEAHETKILIASLLSRMVLPFVFIAPILALSAKYLNISILDDPIFVIVCFLLTGAPSALQLAQICQINGVYEGVMARILFWSYVVIILPSTLVLVVTAIKVVEWSMIQ
ncbi:hypothetical protein RUND412_009955 [Rhizina undulata]